MPPRKRQRVESKPLSVAWAEEAHERAKALLERFRTQAVVPTSLDSAYNEAETKLASVMHCELRIAAVGLRASGKSRIGNLLLVHPSSVQDGQKEERLWGNVPFPLDPQGSGHVTERSALCVYSEKPRFVGLTREGEVCTENLLPAEVIAGSDSAQLLAFRDLIREKGRLSEEQYAKVYRWQLEWKWATGPSVTWLDTMGIEELQGQPPVLPADDCNVVFVPTAAAAGTTELRLVLQSISNLLDPRRPLVLVNCYHRGKAEGKKQGGSAEEDKDLAISRNALVALAADPLLTFPDSSLDWSNRWLLFQRMATRLISFDMLHSQIHVPAEGKWSQGSRLMSKVRDRAVHTPLVRFVQYLSRFIYWFKQHSSERYTHAERQAQEELKRALSAKRSLPSTTEAIAQQFQRWRIVQQAFLCLKWVCLRLTGSLSEMLQTGECDDPLGQPETAEKLATLVLSELADALKKMQSELYRPLQDNIRKCYREAREAERKSEEKQAAAAAMDVTDDGGKTDLEESDEDEEEEGGGAEDVTARDEEDEVDVQQEMKLSGWIATTAQRELRSVVPPKLKRLQSKATRSAVEQRLLRMLRECSRAFHDMLRHHQREEVSGEAVAWAWEERDVASEFAAAAVQDLVTSRLKEWAEEVQDKWGNVRSALQRGLKERDTVSELVSPHKEIVDSLVTMIKSIKNSALQPAAWDLDARKPLHERTAADNLEQENLPDGFLLLHDLRVAHAAPDSNFKEAQAAMADEPVYDTMESDEDEHATPAAWLREHGEELPAAEAKDAKQPLLVQIRPAQDGDAKAGPVTFQARLSPDTSALIETYAEQCRQHDGKRTSKPCIYPVVSPLWVYKSAGYNYLRQGGTFSGVPHMYFFLVEPRHVARAIKELTGFEDAESRVIVVLPADGLPDHIVLDIGKLLMEAFEFPGWTRKIPNTSRHYEFSTRRLCSLRITLDREVYAAQEVHNRTFIALLAQMRKLFAIETGVFATLIEVAETKDDAAFLGNFISRLKDSATDNSVIKEGDLRELQAVMRRCKAGAKPAGAGEMKRRFGSKRQQERKPDARVNYKACDMTQFIPVAERDAAGVPAGRDPEIALAAAVHHAEPTPKQRPRVIIPSHDPSSLDSVKTCVSWLIDPFLAFSQLKHAFSAYMLKTVLPRFPRLHAVRREGECSRFVYVRTQPLLGVYASKSAAEVRKGLKSAKPEVQVDEKKSDKVNREVTKAFMDNWIAAERRLMRRAAGASLLFVNAETIGFQYDDLKCSGQSVTPASASPSTSQRKGQKRARGN